ncbi:polysaccharide deacetylase family protein [Aneurinibacillus sp. UBA3580]|jgi:probable sporulation protein (polysaccharide deacetylase family)|uniref:polysaccharide deacetylase family protein n=1 Tax=Aneurinibacillus sp. UBA3580 TaxID=1946041 RepID=UPI00257B517B|nr:polysaccharide deacetylase family protein [Aneurinibacillus sp. UBA3580]
MNRLLALLCFLFFLYSVMTSESVNLYIASKKMDRAALTNQVAQWEQQLKEAAKTKNIPPVNARIDPIWKAIPGYNGLSIDEEASLQRMQQAGRWDESLIVYREVKPTIGLDQLAAAPIYRGNSDKPMVSLMINVAWGNEYLPAILETLKKEKVKATFFLDGSWTKKYPDEAKKIAEAGHEIGSHAYSHPNMSQLSLTRMEQEITKTNTAITEATGITPTLFAPPSGDFDQRVVDMAARYHLRTILWTADTVDWRKPSPDQWFRTVAPKINNGVLVLMHPTAPTAEALPRLIRYVKEKKLTLGTVSDTLSTRRVPPY